MLKKLIAKDLNTFVKNKQLKNLANKNEFYIRIHLEQRLEKEQNSKKKRKDSDILILIENRESQLLYIFCIEIKIKSSSYSQEQLDKLYDHLKTSIEDPSNPLNISVDDKQLYQLGFFYIIPSELLMNSKAKTDVENFFTNTKGCPIKAIAWRDESGEDNIVSYLEWLIGLEKHGKIEPFNDQFRFLLPSFLNFIQSNFKSRDKEKDEEEKGRKRWVYNTEILQVISKERPQNLSMFNFMSTLFKRYETSKLLTPRLAPKNMHLSYATTRTGKNVAFISIFKRDRIKVCLRRDQISAAEWQEITDNRNWRPEYLKWGVKVFRTVDELKMDQDLILRSIESFVTNKQ